MEAIVATMREVVACLNTGSALTLFAFVTDDFVRYAIEISPITRQLVDVFAAGSPAFLPPEGYGSLVAVREVTVLPDGRVGALVDTIEPPESPDVQTAYYVFVEEDGRWPIDERVENLEEQYPPEPVATPAA